MDNKFDKYSDQVAFRTAYLVAGYIRGTLSQAEHLELDEWVAASDENMLLFERLTDEKNIEAVSKQWMEEKKISEALKRTKEKISFTKEPGRSVLLRFLPYAVAASLILVSGLVFLKPFKGKNDQENTTVTTMQDINPGGNKAMLILADGKTIVLDSAVNGLLTTEGRTDILKTDGQLVYTKDDAENNEPIYHTITTPKGGQYRVILSDGSMVWLNASSSIYYPVKFTGDERTVRVTGEVYFEVAPSISPNGGGKRPFFVRFNNRSGESGVVEVLGTHFNVNTYADEPTINVTLAEGTVKVSMVNPSTGAQDEWVMLEPGQQAQVNRKGDIKTVSANIEETIAWKDGQFLFKDALIEDIMRQVARWYDTEIVFENKPDYHFNATVPRNVLVSKLLYYLELTERVHFKIENKKIIVMK